MGRNVAKDAPQMSKTRSDVPRLLHMNASKRDDRTTKLLLGRDEMILLLNNYRSTEKQTMNSQPNLFKLKSALQALFERLNNTSGI